MVLEFIYNICACILYIDEPNLHCYTEFKHEFEERLIHLNLLQAWHLGSWAMCSRECDQQWKARRQAGMSQHLYAVGGSDLERRESQKMMIQCLCLLHTPRIQCQTWRHGRNHECVNTVLYIVGQLPQVPSPDLVLNVKPVCQRPSQGHPSCSPAQIGET